ncbi:hypothetical protein M422DRAFT_241445 [Sphaerobolus stellatus SS14]|nr:hypothetical protein M422DRAFT_241445 [Sphaerobolus stellatus SS14]
MSGSQLPFFEPLADLSPHAISARVFPFTTKRRRQRDLLVLEQESESSASGSVDVCLYVNPFEDGAYADISKNGYNDVIVIDQIEQSSSSSSLGLSLGAHVAWFENSGSDDCTWIRREIGRVHTRGILKGMMLTHVLITDIYLLSAALPP